MNKFLMNLCGVIKFLITFSFLKIIECDVFWSSEIYFSSILTVTGLKKNRQRTVCPFVDILLGASFYNTSHFSTKIRMALKAPHSPVSVKLLRQKS